MATLIDVERVKYSCSCKRLKPISNLYYCKYCKPFALKCKECVLHEIDQKYFCANCFDNKSQAEASGTKFKCMNCFACPLCKNSLMMRASSGTAAQKAAMKAAALAAEQNRNNATTSGEQPAASAPPVATKVYYLMCSFCRWTTRDVGIPDVTSIPGNWKQPENTNVKRIKELLEAYKVVAAREKVEKDRKKYTTTKRRQFHLGSSGLGFGGTCTLSSSSLQSDKYGILSPASRRLKNLNPTGQPETIQQSIEVQMKALLAPAQIVRNFDPLVPEDFFSNMNINSITTINQRHSNPEFQPTRSMNLYPLNKFYVNKESKRCNGCEHNVLKPESNITSIRFKLHQMAIFMVPDIRIITIPEWKINEPNDVIISITNKSEIDLNVAFVQLSTETNNNEETNLSGFVSNATVSFGEQEDKPILIERQDNSKQQQPALKQSDCETNGFVCFRRDNKVAVSFKVTPLSEVLDKIQGTPRVRIALGLKHCLDHKAISDSSALNTSQQSLTSSTTRPTIVQKIFLDLGPLKAEDGLKVIPKPKYIEDLVNSTTLKSEAK